MQKYLSVTLLMLIITFVLVFMFSSCSTENGDDESSDSNSVAQSPNVIIEGDIENGFTRLNEPNKNTALDADPEQNGFGGMKLTDFISKAKPSGEPKEIYFTSADGFIACVDYNDADKIYMIYNERKGFCVIAPKHPLNAQGQELDRIIVVSEGSKVGLNIVNADGNKILIPKGKILISPLTESMWFRGESDMEKGNEIHSSKVYTKELSTTIGDIYDKYNDDPIVILTKDGNKYLSDGSGRIVIGETEFDYVDEAENRYEGVVKILIN